jgi:hypothetical protein
MAEPKWIPKSDAVVPDETCTHGACAVADTGEIQASAASISIEKSLRFISRVLGAV